MGQPGREGGSTWGYRQGLPVSSVRWGPWGLPPLQLRLPLLPLLNFCSPSSMPSDRRHICYSDVSAPGGSLLPGSLLCCWGW